VTDFEIPENTDCAKPSPTTRLTEASCGAPSFPELNDLAAQMERYCPDALLLNYVNPMAPLVWAVSDATAIRTVGLCHSVQGTAAELASILGIPAAEIDYDCAGINHMAFYTRFERDGQDLYPMLRAIEAAKTYPAWEAPRFTLMRDFRFFVTESSEHLSEYVPWFIKGGRPDLIEKFSIPLDEYPARCIDQIADWSSMRAALLSDDPNALTAYQTERGETLSGNWERKLARERLRDPESEQRLRRLLLEERLAASNRTLGRIWHADHPFAYHRRALGHLGQRSQRGPDRQSPRRLRGGSRVRCRCKWFDPAIVRSAAAPARIADDHQYQSATDDGPCRPEPQPPVGLSGRHARSTHCRRARSRPDSCPGRRVDRRPW